MAPFPSDFEECEQIIAPDGSYDSEAVESLSIDDETYRQLYESMVQARELEERGMILQRQGELHFWEECRGEEASHVGPAAALESNDWLQSDWRQYGMHIQRGRSIEDILLFWLRGYETWDDEYAQRNDPAAQRRMPHTVAIGTTIPQAVGMIWGQTYQDNDDVMLVQMGEGATSKGDFHEGLNFAGVLNLPAAVLVVNNQWAISVPAERQTASETFAQKATGYGFDGILVDGNDVLATYRATKRAVENARSGEGPMLVEALTYRRGAHSSSDDPSIYRDEAEVEKWAERDPIDRYEQFLEDRGLWSEEYAESVREDAKARAKEAADTAIEIAAEQSHEEVFDKVYANPPDHIQAQANELDELLDEFGEDAFGGH